MPMPQYVGWNQAGQAALQQAAETGNSLTNMQLRQQMMQQQAQTNPLELQLKQQEVAQGAARAPFASELAQVPLYEQQRKREADRLRSEAAKRKDTIAQQIADARTEAVRLAGDIGSPQNKVRLAQAIANIETLQERMNHETRLEQQFLYGQGFTDSPFSKNQQSPTLDYLKQSLTGNQGSGNPAQPAIGQQPQVPQASVPVSPTQPPVRASQGRLITTDEQGNRMVIPQHELPAAQAVMEASSQGQPLTAQAPDQLMAPREQGNVPEDLMRLPVAARMKAFNARMEEVPAQTARINSSAAALDNIADTAKLALEHESLGPATGLTGMVTSRIPGMGPYNVKEIIESLEAKLAFASLGDLRQQSKTGGALGQVSDREQEMLKKAIASLKLAQSEKDVKRALEDVKSYASSAKDRLIKSYEQTYGQKPDLTEYHTITQRGDKKTNAYVEIRTTKDGRKLGKKADGTIEEIK